MADSKRIPPDGGPGLSHNPFAALSSEGLPPAPDSLSAANPGGESVPPSRLISSLAPPDAAKPAGKNRGRVDILRVKAGRGGKTVTVVKNFAGIRLPEKEQLARAMQRACGTGGTVKNG
jgi:translation initiation factor 1